MLYALVVGCRTFCSCFSTENGAKIEAHNEPQLPTDDKEKKLFNAPPC